MTRRPVSVALSALAAAGVLFFIFMMSWEGAGLTPSAEAAPKAAVQLNWERVGPTVVVCTTYCPPDDLHRARLPDGWIVSGNNDILYVPDPTHAWK